jgi:hypothetical protein
LVLLLFHDTFPSPELDDRAGEIVSFPLAPDEQGICSDDSCNPNWIKPSPSPDKRAASRIELFVLEHHHIFRPTDKPARAGFANFVGDWAIVVGW